MLFYNMHLDKFEVKSLSLFPYCFLLKKHHLQVNYPEWLDKYKHFPNSEVLKENI